jgi:DNA-directed RNA polymerase subunit RPC12/RpoP
MVPVQVQLCLVFRCSSCGHQFARELPLAPGTDLKCGGCGREVYVDTSLMNRVEVMRAQALSRLCRQ